MQGERRKMQLGEMERVWLAFVVLFYSSSVLSPAADLLLISRLDSGSSYISKAGAQG